MTAWRTLVVCVGGVLGIASAQAGKLDSGSEARSIISALEARATDSPVAKEPVARAKEVLARADEARAQQREGQARLLDDFGLEWAQTAQHLLEASKLEAEAQAIDEKLSDVEVKLRRARALLEETETRRGRARTELQRLEPESVEQLDPSGPLPPGAPTTAPAAPRPPSSGAAATGTALPAQPGGAQ